MDEVERRRVLVNRVLPNFSRRIVWATIFLWDSCGILGFVRAQPGHFPLSPAISAQGTAFKGEGLGRAIDSRCGRARIPVSILHSTGIQRIPPDLCTCLLILSALVAPSLRIRAACSCKASATDQRCTRADAPSPTRRVSRQPARILLTAQCAWKSEF